MARATTVVGKIFESISTDRRVNTKYTAWVARLGQIFWAFVEVSVPRSFFHLTFRHWLKLLYFLEALLIVGSTLLVQPQVQRFAITLFGITAAIHLTSVMLSDKIQRRNGWIKLAKYVGGFIVVLLITLGGLTFSTFFGAAVVWEWIEQTRTWFVDHTRLLWLGTIVGVVLVMLWSIRNDVADLINGEN
jgi:magnesium-transporting ATPase (P-type)